ncbi:MAG TPA: HEAT repeat domain-containing protein, partial [Gemmataceae bacterium]|nr:HEAT repeat domain-containing protein [Gemmataceae bacterium]
SGDKNFRPINMKWGPNGDIYVIDWHDQNPCHQAALDSWDYDHGRIYRIQLKGTPVHKPFDLSKWTDLELAILYTGFSGPGVNPPYTRTGSATYERLKGILGAKGYLGAPTPYWRRSAGRLLAERADKLDREAREVLGTAPILGPPDEARGLEAIDGTFAHEAWMRQSRPGIPPEYDAQPRAALVRELSERPALSEKAWDRLAKLAAAERYAPVRRELASLALRHAAEPGALAVIRALVSHKEDAKDPVIPQLVWLAYEKVLSIPGGGGQSPQKSAQGADPPRSVEAELTWLGEQAPDNEFVRDQIVPKAMRRLVATGKPDDLELCIGFVASTKDPATREKALDGLATALNYQTVNAPPSWAALQEEIRTDGNPRLVPLANKLAVSFRDPKAIKRAVAVAANTGLPTAERVEAVRQLGQLKAPETVALLLSLLRKDTEVSVRAEAARSLAAFDDPKLGAEILADWKSYPKALQADVVNTLATRKEWARALLQAMADGKVDRSAVTDNTILRIQAFKDPELNKLIEKAWGRTRPTPAELTATIDKTRASLADGPGSFARGRVVFENTCGKCHKFDGKGADVGPALDGSARDIEYILVNVIDPNRVIGAPYFVRVARLQDGTVQQGLLAEEDAKSITLKQENGVLKTIAKADLEGPVQVVEKSLMPEGLGYNLTPQDFRDLVRYLMANPFLTDVTVNGEKVSAGVPGRIALPEAAGGPVVIEAELSATANLKTALLVGSSADYEVRLDGKSIGTGKGTGKLVQPDQGAFEVTLPKGKHTVAVVVKGGGSGGAVYARFADPDRKLRYPDPGEKK